jgi:Fe2+ or Zn2+ uptake regulation protein
MYPTTIETIKEYLEFNDIKPSLQRVKIYQYLSEQKSHPTVDEIFSDIGNDLVTLSKTTVYNTLHLFVEKGIAIPIHVEGNEIRYDADIKSHAHFKCNNCGKVYDVPIESHALDFKELDGFNIDDFQIFMRGTCSMCLKKASA